jgi:ribonuclease H
MSYKSLQKGSYADDTNDGSDAVVALGTAIAPTGNAMNNASGVPSHVYCPCLYATLCNKCGIPLKDRDQTKKVIAELCTSQRPKLANVYGRGPLLLSDVPKSATRTNTTTTTGSPDDVVLGIDEAGRGSVLGPMVYGAAYWSSACESKIPKDFNDSKQLKEDDRERLFETILNHNDIGFVVRSLLPSEISRNMQRVNPYNLNEMSHDAAISIIRKLVDNGIQVKTAYIDTVGNPKAYQRKLEGQFPGIEFVVESKADAKYAPCSAASVGEWLFGCAMDIILHTCICTGKSTITHSLSHTHTPTKLAAFLSFFPFTMFIFNSRKSNARSNACELEIFGTIIDIPNGRRGEKIA